jgi:ABC-type multidrug transport system ATPase subunit
LFEHAMEEPPVVVAEELTKRFGDVLAVDDLSFTLPRGSVAGFLGPNGEVQTLRPAC